MKGYNWKKFIVFMVICGLVGAIGGGTLQYLISVSDPQSWIRGLEQMAPSLYIVAFIVGVIGLIGYIFFNTKLKKENYSDEEDSFYERYEKIIDVTMMCSTLCAIINFMAIGLNLLETTPFDILFIINVVLAFVGEVLYISLVKKIRPELDADPLQANFKNHYFDKLDEYEKNKTGKACFQTISVMTVVYVVLFVACYILTLLFDISPIICLPVGIIWLTQTVLMTYYSSKEVKAKR